MVQEIGYASANSILVDHRVAGAEDHVPGLIDIADVSDVFIAEEFRRYPSDEIAAIDVAMAFNAL